MTIQLAPSTPNFANSDLKGLFEALDDAFKHNKEELIRTIRGQVGSELSSLGNQDPRARPSDSDVRHCLQLAAMCHRYGWSEEYRRALALTPSLDIFGEGRRVECSSISGSNLLILHIYKYRCVRDRRFREKLSTEAQMRILPPSHADTLDSGCTAWQEFTFSKCHSTIEDIFDLDASGRTLLEWSKVADTVRQFHRKLVDTKAFRAECICQGFDDHDVESALVAWKAIVEDVVASLSSYADKDLDACDLSYPSLSL